MIDLLILLLKPALLWSSNPRKYWYLTPLAFVALVADAIAAHTAWALIAGRPKQNEWTISHTLERLTLESGNDQMFYISLARKINRMAPGGRHIKAVV